MTELRAKWRKDGSTRSGQYKGRWWARFHTHINMNDPITKKAPPYFEFSMSRTFWDRTARDKFVKEQNQIVKNCSTDEEYYLMYKAIEALTKE